ncbi:MAG: hypothetical protein HY898_14655 [Deltaproteobacteria bacterium]|nr:hypothetical protein [Deltaproteobacteria bacterium]
MADMDGTGRADIVGIGNDGVFVATNTGGSFSPCVPPAAVDGPQCWRSIARDTYDKNWTDEVQGVACDQSHWFFSTNSRQLKLGSTPQGIYVFKVGPKLDNQVASIAFKDLPKTFNKRDDEHWGQISYAEDRLYVAYYCYIAENEKRTAVAVFAWDGKQLAFERWILLEPISDGTSTYYPEFQCISPASDLLYSCKGGPNPGVFHAHDPSTGKVVLGKEIRFTGGEGLGLHGNGAQVDIPSEVQGACISPNGHVYMTCNVWIGDDALGKKPVACFSRSTGKLIGMIPIDCPGDFDTHELEGLCYAIVPCGTSSSTLQVVVLRNQTVEFDDLMFEELSADASDRI